jgi:hypothetical protein
MTITRWCINHWNWKKVCARKDWDDVKRRAWANPGLLLSIFRNLFIVQVYQYWSHSGFIHGQWNDADNGESRTYWNKGFVFFFYLASFLRFLVHTQGHTTVRRTPPDEGSARGRDLHLTTQRSQKSNIHAAGGTRTRNQSKQSAVRLN